MDIYACFQGFNQLYKDFQSYASDSVGKKRLLCLVDHHQSSVLNVSNANSKPEEFSIKDIEMLVDSKEQNWFKQVHIGNFLGLRHVDTSVESLDKCKILARNDINAIPS